MVLSDATLLVVLVLGAVEGRSRAPCEINRSPQRPLQ